ncbi:Uncharacterised protein [Bordetella pertussis]|nr:Uncharacterised protein [Bordetella pertussis]
MGVRDAGGQRGGQDRGEGQAQDDITTLHGFPCRKMFRSVRELCGSWRRLRHSVRVSGLRKRKILRKLFLLLMAGLS